MANPIQATDIIESKPIIDQLNDVKNNLEGLRTALQETAKGEKINLANLFTTGDTNKAAERVKVLVDAMADLRKAYKENEDAINKIASASANMERIERRKAEGASATSREWQKQTIEQQKATKEGQKAIATAEALANIHKMLAGNLKTTELSYNQLSAMYTKMSAQLKTLSADEIQATQENRALATATKQVRDAMNDAQKAMGNYSLNVGRYHTAFDGLGFSIQQVLREIPSATTVSQFFLAISNNIPMVVDQLKLFKDEQADIKKQLGELKEGTKEYMELQSKQMSVGAKLFKSILSWQTAIIVGLLLLRKYGEDIIKSIGNLLSKTAKETRILKEVNDGAASSVGSLTAEYVALQKEWKSLGEGDKDAWVKKHTDALKDLNIPLNNALDAENAFVKNTDMVVRAIDARARSIAGMKLAAEKYEKAFNIRQDALAALRAGKMGFGGSLIYGAVTGGMSENGVSSAEQLGLQERVAEARRNIKYNKSIASAKELEQEAYDIITRWVLPDADKGGGKSKEKKNNAPVLQDIKDRYWEIENLKLQIMQEGYDKEIALEKMNLAKALEENEMAYDEQVTALNANLRNKLITQEEYAIQIAKVNKEHAMASYLLEQESAKKQQEIWNKYEIERIKSAIKYSKADLELTNKRIKTRQEEEGHNKIIFSNIDKLYMQLEEQQAINTEGVVGGEELKQAAIQETINLIEKQKNSLSFDKRLTSKFKIADLLSSGRSLDAKRTAIKGFYTDKEMENMTPEQVEANYDRALENTLNGLKTWKDTTIDYIGQVIDAWIELAQARVEAAEEETEAAKTEYEYQKSLMDAGYANTMSIAYTEYKEKQALQKQAEEEAKQAQKAQQAIDTATQISSLVTAVANIWANATKAGLLAPAVAGVMTATMIGSFIAAKAMAANVANYGEGGYEVMQGGSHASGHDIDLGVNNRHGKRMHVEGGEGLAVISNKAKRRYGHSAIESVINSINNGTFDPSAGQLTRVSPVVAYQSSSVNLGKVENSLSNIERNSSRQSYVTANGDIIEIEGSLKRTIRKA